MRIRIIGVLRNCIFGMAGIAAVAAVAASIGLFWFLAGKAEKDATDMMERCREYMRAEVEEKTHGKSGIWILSSLRSGEMRRILIGWI